MSESRDVILKRIQLALGSRADDRTSYGEEVKRDYDQKSELDAHERLDLFNHRVSEYKAVTEMIPEGRIGEKVAEICKNGNIKKLVVPPGIEENWLPDDGLFLTVLKDAPEPLTHDELNGSDAVLTGCFLAVAQTGTIILNAGPGQGRRVLTLLPDFHLCIVRSSQIVSTIPEAIKELDEIVKKTEAPITFISGPSATSDIELIRVEGVHGPRKLHVLIVT